MALIRTVMFPKILFNKEEHSKNYYSLLILINFGFDLLLSWCKFWKQRCFQTYFEVNEENLVSCYLFFIE